LVPWWAALSRCGPSCCAVHGRIADGRPCGWAGRSGQLRRSVCAVTTVGPHRRLFHGPPRTGRSSGRFRLDQHARAGSWALRLPRWWDLAAETIVVPTPYGSDSRQAHRQVRPPPRLRRSGRELEFGDWLAAFGPPRSISPGT
jgi:hypothetical protein